MKSLETDNQTVAIGSLTGLAATSIGYATLAVPGNREAHSPGAARVLDGKQLEAIVLLGDIRARAVYGVSLTVQAYHGNYQEGGDVAGPTKAEARLPPG